MPTPCNQESKPGDAGMSREKGEAKGSEHEQLVVLDPAFEAFALKYSLRISDAFTNRYASMRKSHLSRRPAERRGPLFSAVSPQGRIPKAHPLR